MCLVMMHYPADAGANSGATCVVPGSHRDTRKLRGLDAGISPTVAILGEIHVNLSTGAVWI